MFIVKQQNKKNEKISRLITSAITYMYFVREILFSKLIRISKKTNHLCKLKELTKGFSFEQKQIVKIDYLGIDARKYKTSLLII
jgi:hypothetical protein